MGVTNTPLYQAMIRGMKHMEQALGDQTVEWKSESYPCVPADLNLMEELGIGGVGTDADKILLFRTEVFSNAIYPRTREFMIMDNKTFQIEHVVLYTNKAGLVVYLKDPNRKLVNR